MAHQLYLKQFFCQKHQTYIPGGYESFREHVNRKDHVAPFICGQGGCCFEFASRPSLFRHIRDHHVSAPPEGPVFPPNAYDIQCSSVGGYNPASDPAVLQEDIFRNICDEEESMARDEEEEAEVCDEEPAPINLRASAELSVLRLRSITYMTSTAIKAVETECFSMMQDTASYLKSKVQDFLSEPQIDVLGVENLLKEFSLSDPFNHIRTKSQQLNCFKNKYGLLLPKEVFLDTRFDSRQHPSRPGFQPTQVQNSFQYLSIIQILTQVMLDDDLRNKILSESASDDGYFRTFKDGSLFGTLPEELRGAIRIILYLDDLELLQALSAMQGVYKICGVYFGIQNLPPALNALLANIWVTILCYASDSLQKKVWENFLHEMKILETVGVQILVHGRPFRFHAVLVAQIGDDLAAHDIVGLKRPSAKLFCRACYITRDELWASGFECGEPRNAEKHARDVAAARVSAAMQKATGVLGPSPLDGLRFFKPIEHSVFDIFHDLNQGLCKMEIKLALRYYVCVKKYLAERLAKPVDRRR